MNLIEAFGGVFSIILMVSLGVALYVKGWIKSDTEDFITKFVLKITIPLFMFVNGYHNVTAEFLESSWKQVLIAFASIIIAYLLGFGFSILFKIPKNERGICTMIFSLSNTLFVGLPVCTYYFGQEAIPSVIMYYMANTVMFWTVGTAMIAHDAGQITHFSLKTLGSIFSPPVTGFVFGGVIAMAGITMPRFLEETLSSVGAMTTPLVTILTGFVIAKAGTKRMLSFTRTSVLGLFGRYIVSPLIMIGLLVMFAPTQLTAKTFVLQSAMPVMNQSLLSAAYYKANDTVVAQALATSVILMMVFTPAYVLIGNMLFR
ncbi:MAG: AEC family transporter [Bacillota bacterium]|nr:AEC family transporter [Bacillota bacterium]